MSFSGGCLCGAVRYHSTQPPLTTRACWCRDCQYIGAGTATVNMVFPAEAVTITGDLQDFVSPAAGGNIMHRRFCPHCGTPLFSGAESRPHLVVIRAGTLDDPNLVRPAITIWTSSAPQWACFDPTLPQTEAQPPPA